MAGMRHCNEGTPSGAAPLSGPHQAPARHPRKLYGHCGTNVKVRAPYDARQLPQRLGLGLGQILSTTPGQLEGRFP